MISFRQLCFNNLSSSNSLQSKASATAGNRSNYDGYINHAFSDLPLEDVANQPPVQVAPPVAQIAKFRLDLANVKSDLIHLQEVVGSYKIDIKY